MPSEDPRKYDLILRAAARERGKRYAGPVIGEADARRWGDPGWDCSSFVAGVFRQIGIQLTPFTDAAARETELVDPSQARPGDIIFYKGAGSGGNSAAQNYHHMGIYLGNGQMIDAQYQGGVGVHSVLNEAYEIRRPKQLHAEQGPSVADLAVLVGDDAASRYGVATGSAPPAQATTAATGGGAMNGIAKLVFDTGYQYAKSKGADEANAKAFAQTMVTIAYGESSLNPGAVRDTRDGNDPLIRSGQAQPEYSVGLFQLNFMGGKGSASGLSAEAAMDPATNARIAASYLWDTFQQHGGAPAFGRDPISFVSTVYQRGQGSVTPNVQRQILPGLAISDPATFSSASGPGVTANVANTPANLIAQATPEAAQKVLQQKILDTIQGDPLEAAETLPALTSALKTITDQINQGTASPDTVFSVTASVGIQREEIAARAEEAARNRQHEAAMQGSQQTFTAGENQAQRTFQGGENAADRALSSQQFDARLAEDSRQFNATYGLDQQRVQLAREAQGLDQQRLTLDQTIGLGQLEIAQKTYGLQEKEAALSEKRYGLEERRAASDEWRAALGSVIDLVAMQVQQQELSLREADSILDALVETWKEHPTQSPYTEGNEPGGPAAWAASQMGYTHDPAYYRVKQFPMDLEAMYKAKSQNFSMSDAWQTAVKMMQDSKQFGGPMAAVAGMGDTLPGGGSAAAATQAATAPTAPAQPAAPQFNVQVPPIQAQVPGQPAAQPQAATPPAATPTAATPPAAQAAAAAPPTIPQCGPGFEPAWDGQAYYCKPVAGAALTPGAPAPAVTNPAAPGVI